ncbi:MAG: hypothetical protein J6Y32_04745 [Bacteroidales bacterium]|nr:hypothetical protein [Bacteroidales bacterium]
MNIIEIKDAIEEEIVARGWFFVDLTVSKDNDVCLSLEARKGNFGLDDCAAVSALFEAAFDREKEDYSLTVSSAGLDQPFKVPQQFEKAVGDKVEVSLKGGKRLVAKLEAYDGQSITLRYESLEKPEGSKKKVRIEKCENFPLDQVNAVRPYVEFE